MIYQVPEEFRRTPLEFKIVSTLGWMEKEKFYQPYQIWTLERYKFSQEQDSQISMGEQTEEETFLWSWIMIRDICSKIQRNGDDEMVTDGRRLFKTTLFTPSNKNEQEVEEFLEKISILNVDIPEALREKYDIIWEQFELENLPFDDDQEDDSHFWETMDSPTLHNIENMMEG